MARELNIRIEVDDTGARGKLRETEDSIRGVEGAAADVTKRMVTSGQTMVRVGGSMRGVGTALTLGVTAPLAAAGGAALKMAMDAVESENLFGVSFGQMADRARAWSETTSDALGLNAFELRRNAGLIFTMSRSMGLQEEAAFGMATGMTELAGDMASFFNLRPEEAFEKLRSGIVGQTEPLRALGILVDETTVKQFAMANGFKGVWEETDQGTKAMFRWQAILAQTTNAQGDLARTLDSPTNQLRLMREQMSEVSIQLGVALLPVFESFLGLAQRVVPWIESAVQWFANLPAPVQQVALGLTAVGVALGPLLLGLGGLIGTFGSVIAAMGSAGITFGAIGTTIAAIATGPIGVLVAAVVGLGAIWLAWGDDIQRIVAEVYTAVKTWLWDKLEPVLTPLGALIVAIGEMFQAFGQLVGAVVLEVLEWAGKLVTGVTAWLVEKLQPIFVPLGKAISGIASVFASMYQAVSRTVQEFYATVKTWLVDKFVGIINSVREKVQAVTGFFRDMYDKVVGHSYVPDLIRGIDREFAKLGTVMVGPTAAATGETAGLFGTLASSVATTMDTLRGTLSSVFSVDGLKRLITDPLGTVLDLAFSMLDTFIRKAVDALTGLLGRALGLGSSLASGAFVDSAIGGVGAGLGGGAGAGAGAGGAGILGTIGSTLAPIGAGAAIGWGIWQGFFNNPHRPWDALTGQQEAGRFFDTFGGQGALAQMMADAGLSEDTITRLLEPLGDELVLGVRSSFDAAIQAIQDAMRGAGVDLTGAEFPSFATGSQGRFLDFGAGRLAMLHGEEAIVRRGDSEGLAEAIASALRGRVGGGRVNIFIDRRKLAEIIVPEIPGVAQDFGIAG